jgi:hypothetical protein
MWMMTLAMLLAHVSERTASAQPVFAPSSHFGPFVQQAQLPATGPTAISGDTALVAMDGIVHVFERDPSTDAWTEALPLTPSDGAAMFGRAIAIDGARAIVGADGAAYIFRRRRDGVWRERIRLVASDGNPDFGASVDIDGNHAIVGAPAPVLTALGAAYVFARNPGGAQRWTEVARLSGGGSLRRHSDCCWLGEAGWPRFRLSP